MPLFTLLFAVVANLSLADTANDPAAALLQNPTAAAIDAACQSIATDTLYGKVSPLTDTVRQLLQKASTKDLVLSSLSRYPAKVFDLDLYSLLPDGDADLPPDVDLVLGAAGTSGSLLTAEHITAICSRPSQSLFKIRVALWKAKEALDGTPPLSEAFLFHSYGIGAGELEGDPKLRDLLISYVNRMQADTRLLAKCFNTLSRCLNPTASTFGVTPPPAPAQAMPPNRKAFQKALENCLVAINSPLSRIVLTSFSRSPDPEFVKDAHKFDYTVLNNEPWLLPIGQVMSAPIPVEGLPLPAVPTHFVNLRRLRFLQDVSGQNYHFSNEEAKSRTKFTEDALTGYSAILCQAISREYKIPLTPTKWTGKLDATQVINNYVELEAAILDVKASLATAFIKQGQAAQDAATDAAFLIDEETHRQALVAHAIMMARRISHSADKSVQFGEFDRELDNFEKRELPGVIHTAVVNKLPVHPLPTDALSGAAAVRLISRVLCFKQGAYQEHLELTVNGKVQSLDWSGTIPLPLVKPLLRHPRLLDFSGTSLAARDWQAMSWLNRPVEQDIDLVRMAPGQSLTLLGAALERPDTPWDHYRQLLLAEYLRPIPMPVASSGSAYGPERNSADPFFFLPYTLPAAWSVDPDALSLAGLPAMYSTEIMSTQKDFDRQKELMTRPLQELVMAMAEDGGFNEIVQKLNKMDEYRKGIDNWFGALPGGTSTGKDEGIRLVNRHMDEWSKARGYEQFFDHWNLSSVKEWYADKKHHPEDARIILRRLIISPDLKQFFGTYEIKIDGCGFHFFNVGGSLPTIPPLIEQLIRNHELNFLNANQLDLGGRTADSSARFSAAASNTLQKLGSNPVANRLLNQTGLYPIGVVPVDGKLPTVCLASPMGATDLALWNISHRVASYFSTAALEPPTGIPALQVVEETVSQWDDISAGVRTAAGKGAQPVIDWLDHFNDKETSVFIGVRTDSSGNTTVMFTVNKGDFGFSLSNMPGSPVTLSPVFQGKIIPVNVLGPVRTVANGPNVRESALDLPPQSYAQGVYVPSRSLASVPDAGNPSNAHPELNVTTWYDRVVPLNWQDLPPIMVQWSDNEASTVERAWLGGLIGQASEALTDDEKVQIFNAVRSRDVFPQNLMDLLYQRRKEALEKEKIANGEWVHTEVANFLPLVVNGTARYAYIKDFNAKNDRTLQAATDKKMVELNTKKPFTDGLPAIRLTYSNDFKFMLWHYDYAFRDGTVISVEHISDTPFWLADRAAKDPTGHVLENLMSASLEDFIQHGGASGWDMLHKLADFRDAPTAATLDMINETINSAAETRLDLIKKDIAAFFNSISAWIRSENVDQNKPSTESGIRTPFLPTPAQTPVLSCFVSPLQWMEWSTEGFGEILSGQQSCPLGSALSNDQLTIDLPQYVVQ